MKIKSLIACAAIAASTALSVPAHAAVTVAKVSALCKQAAAEKIAAADAKITVPDRKIRSADGKFLAEVRITGADGVKSVADCSVDRETAAVEITARPAN